ncbi:MAG: GNAT family N-acetyltransferase [Fuerstiella sp.]|jgi:ElaA protein|nr:GNAT family N-acetyltransferase [Fuerstiella sp.]
MMNSQTPQIQLPKPDWSWHGFSALSTSGLYQILHLRQQVFVIEQQCAYDDIDNHDQVAFHLCGVNSTNQTLQAYLRVLPPGTRFEESSIGRIVTAAECRGCGLGHELMRQSMDFCRDRFPGTAIRLSAQTHLQPFYAAHGFMTVTPEHLIDGISHVEMLLRCSSPGTC